MAQSYSRGIRPVATPADLTQYDQQARRKAVERLVTESADVNSPREAHARQIIPDWDLDAGEGAASMDGWLVVGGQDVDEFEAIAFDSNENLDDKTAVIYGVRALDPGQIGISDEDDQVSDITFRNRTGGTIDRWDISSLMTAADGAGTTAYVGLADNPIFLGTNQSVFVDYVQTGGDIADTADADFTIQFLGIVADKEGQDLEQSGRFIA